jgi:hypothetical protein
MVGRMGNPGNFKSHALLLAAIVVSLGGVGCGGDIGGDRQSTGKGGGGRGDDGSPSGKDGGDFGNSDQQPTTLPELKDAGNTNLPKAVILASMRIEPEDGVLDVDAGEVGTVDYKVFGMLEGGTDEVEITDRSVFFVPDNWKIGGFDQSGPTFATTKDEQRGGVLTVQATAANSDGTTIKIETTLTVRYHSTPADPRDDGSATFKIPKKPASLFDNAKADDALNPELIYPNDGVVLPPNLHRLSVHFRPGPDTNKLFEVSFDSAGAEVVYYVRCGELVDGGCALELDGDSFQLLADSNREGVPVQLQVRGTDDDGKAVGSSEVFDLSFARTDVRGGLYYWRTTDPVGIMRFDFGADATDPEPFLLADDTRLNQQGTTTCVGCHAISRDGTKVVASEGGQGHGYLVLVNDLTRDPGDADFLTKNGDDQNPFQFASFNPKGDRFAGVFADSGPMNTLYMYDGDTGTRLPDESFDLPWEPDHPDWSPDGKMIAVDHVGEHGTSQRPWHCGIEVLFEDKNGPNKGWSDPVSVVPIADGVSRYNPNFAPDSSFLVYSESTCPGGDIRSDQCDADEDPTATTWAVKPEDGAKPVQLATAAQGGVADQGAADLSDTFPRVAPFESELADGTVYWVTVASTRRAGLYNADHKRLLWMYAIDPAKIRDGKDGSSPGFYLPFQDLNTANHIAQWTEQIVTDDPPRKPPKPPTPPSPPPPPPPPEVPD